MTNEKGLLKPEYSVTDEDRKAMNINNDNPKDNITDFGRGITFKTCDGKDVATMEEVMLYNQIFYERMKNKINDYTIENKGMHK